MTCNEMIELMLEADHAALEGTGEGPLAAHVRHCIPCRRAARRVLDSTRMLASEVKAVDPIRRRSGTRRRAAMWLAPVAMAAVAATVFIIAGRGGDSAGQAKDADPGLDYHAPVSALLPPEAPDVRLVPDAAMPPSSVPVRAPVAVAAVATPVAEVAGSARSVEDDRGVMSSADPALEVLAAEDAALAVRHIVGLDGLPGAVESMSHVAVRVPAGRQSAVIHTSNPTITIVWLR